MEQFNIRYHALAMIAGLAKLDRDFYKRDIEAIIAEAKLHGQTLYAYGNETARLTDEHANAVRVAFHTQDFRDIDALWLDTYEAHRADGKMPDAGTAQEAWWD